jgi:hypothetical protein
MIHSPIPGIFSPSSAPPELRKVPMDEHAEPGFAEPFHSFDFWAGVSVSWMERTDGRHLSECAGCLQLRPGP